jgi:hypothetical protein
MDIVERLRGKKSAGGYWREKEAADEIERLREALKLERQLKDDALRAFNEAKAALEKE